MTLSRPNYLDLQPIEKQAYYQRLLDLNQAAELARCAADVVHFVNQHVKTYDPRLSDPFIPFHLFPQQIAFLRWLKTREDNRENGLAEKSRDVGVTWLCCSYAVHGWLFKPGYAVGFGSRKEEYVDRIGDPDSIFEKMRMLLDKLPAWMMPAGWIRNEHATYRKIINPATGANITGESGDNIGRGGRKSLYFVDEAAFIERADLIDRSLSANTDVRIDVSTPNGPGNPFAQKRYGGKVSVFTLHYRDDPRKTTEWIEKKKASMDPVSWAQEYEIDYSASIEGICIPAAWVRPAVDLVLRASGPLVAGFDIGAEGSDSSVIIPRRGPVVLPAHEWRGLLPVQSAHKSIDVQELIGFETLFFDVVGIGIGVKSAFQATERPVMFATVPINTGDPPTEARWPDKQTSQEKFINLRAEAWWTLRERFRRTYERVNGIMNWPDEECISLPNDAQLIAELSMPLIETTEMGKLRLESKDKMKRRGIKSPNKADALVLAFIPMAVKKTFKVW